MDGVWSSILGWINNHGLQVVLLIVEAYIAIRVGRFLLSAIIHRTVGKLQNDISQRDVRKRQDTLISIFSAVLRVAVWLVAGFSILGHFGINPAPLLAGTTVVGVGLGFGAQSIIKDFLSGMFIVVENQYRVGDIVDLVEGSSGVVEQITLRSTTLRDNDGNVHYIPNGTITRAINRTMGYSKVNLIITVAPETNVDELAEIINAVGEKMTKEEKWKKKILEEPKFLSIGAFTKNSLEIKITGKTKPSEQWVVTDELRKRLLTSFKTHKIELAQVIAGAAPATGKKR